MAALGLSRFVTRPMANSLRLLSHGEVADLKGRSGRRASTPARRDRADSVAPVKPQRVVGQGHREQERRDAERGSQHIHEETHTHPAERHQRAALRPWQMERDTRYIMSGPGVSTMPSATRAKAIQLAKCGIDVLRCGALYFHWPRQAANLV